MMFMMTVFKKYANCHKNHNRCDETYDANCDGETTMPFYRAQYDAKTGQSPNMPRYLYSLVCQINMLKYFYFHF